MEDGYEFFAKQGLVTIFCAANYCNEFDNDGAMLNIGSDLLCSFYKIMPAEKALKGKQKGGLFFKQNNKRPGTPQKFRR